MSRRNKKDCKLTCVIESETSFRIEWSGVDPEAFVYSGSAFIEINNRGEGSRIDPINGKVLYLGSAPAVIKVKQKLRTNTPEACIATYRYDVFHKIRKYFEKYGLTLAFEVLNEFVEERNVKVTIVN